MSISVLALALVAAAPLAGTPAVPAHQPAVHLAEAPELAAHTLAAGQAQQAIPALERASAAAPGDAALLINLGIAYAQAGDDAKARGAFEQAAACPDVVELNTADGRAMDSRRLARKALKMLDRGEFRAAPASQLTYRDR